MNIHGTHEHTAVPPLAVELTDMIIDFLHDDKPALHSCALVSRNWLDASQHHLFHTLRLVGIASQYGVDAFLQLLAHKPRFRLYVRALEVLGERWYFRQQSRAACLGPAHLTALAALPFLRSLTLTTVVWDAQRTAPLAPTPSVPRRALDSLTLSNFSSLGDGAAALHDVLAVVAPFLRIDAVHILRTSVRADAGPDLSLPVQVPAVRTVTLGPASRTLYAALARLRLCAAVQRLTVDMGDMAEVVDIARFLHDAAHAVGALELDVSSCRRIWSDLDPELVHDGADWFRDLRLAEGVPLTSFRLSLRSDPPSVFWSLVLSAVSALPSTVRSIDVVAADIMPTGFNELVKLASWQQLADGVGRLRDVQSLRLTFAGLDDYRVAQHARAMFAEKVNAALRQRETLFSAPHLSVAFRFNPEITR